MGWAMDGGEDIGGQMADIDFLADNNLPEEYWAIQDKWWLSTIACSTMPHTIRTFISNLTTNEVVIITDWMIDNGHGNPSFKTKAEFIITDIKAGKMNTLPQNQLRCLLGFIRQDVTKLP